jgi:hypothetical protein
MLTRAVAVFSDADKHSSCIVGGEWLRLLVENVQHLYLRKLMLINTKQFLYRLVFLC